MSQDYSGHESMWLEGPEAPTLFLMALPALPLMVCTMAGWGITMVDVYRSSRPPFLRVRAWPQSQNGN
jgi:hypothetical protein